MARQVFGIDLGTTYSCISGFNAEGRNVVYKNNLGKETTPSVVSFSGYQA
ncbi:MAG: Hsp70 family protein, partial [Victivallales bacterium]|nr:Hsp70 family protein [Victivallales bacterium]